MIWPEILFLAHLPLTGAFIGAGLKHLYSNPNENSNWITGGAIVATSLLLALIIGLVKWLVVRSNKETCLLKRCKIDRMIGYGGIALCGVVPRILVYFLEVKGDYVFHIHYYLTVVSLITSFIFYFLFSLTSQRYCNRINSVLHKIAHFINFFGLIVILVVTSQFIVGLHLWVIAGYHLGYFVMCWVGIREFLGVLGGGALVLKEQEESDEEKTPKVLEKEPLRLDCKLCFITYSTTTHIPRILKECGHTVCEKCVDILLKSHNGQHVFCPFCQKVTVVNGAANSLPKNYETLEAMEWRDAAPSAPEEYIETDVCEED
ncbi:hypothetical protein GCK72_011241 [Caenorhabditis remanei]|uniref:RING-type domain-containing protein n=1 Tax=Caenorhabditis remanei TaxID=31234 RepID=A0A6A5H7X8_CAERE|nr:hypothetical protein GCK72_011241 [Caenorhabditis remanei]KAF1762976.1 hypothetical protein GCK72_011241 [Caenorhabditis remanei]